MNPAVKANAAATGQAGGLCLILLWLVWKVWGLEIPQEVSIPFVMTFSPIFAGVLNWLEQKTGIDIVANGNGQPSQPQTGTAP